ncbi:MAG: hypothetical protein LBG80_11135, partial [Bacteroidales bacterium]|nr:hypothetical protein [Bacteroidales bacterium]
GNIVVVSTNPDGSITETVLTPNGALNNTVVQDVAGNVYVVNSGGTVTEVENTGENSNENANDRHNTDEEDKPLSLIDKGFLYCTVAGRVDTLMDGHSLMIVKDSLVKLKIGYHDRILYNKAYYSLEEDYRKRLVIYNRWNREIKTGNVKWSLPAQNGKGPEFQFMPTTTGVMKLEIDAGDALPVALTDTLGGARIDTIVSGNKLKESKIVVTIHVIEGGILRFKPKNDEYYKNYGFDDAMIPQLQQTGDYGNKLSVSGTDYYVPWLGMLPNTEAEIKMEYISKNPQLDSLIVLERSNTAIKFLPDETKKNIEISASGLIPNIRLKASTEGTHTVKAYSVLKGNIKVQIGLLNVESREYADKTKIESNAIKHKVVRIIRIKRSDETDYAPFSVNQKAELINNINEYYKQAFVKFELNTDKYQDTLTVSQTKAQSINNIIKQVYEKLPITQRKSDEFYVFICSPNPNSTTNGYGVLTGNYSVVFNNSPVTATHELGHNLGLQHTFENVGNRILPKGSTKNIMDYSGNPDLRRYFFLYQINHLKIK